MSAPFDRIIVVDFETAWCRKSGLSLSKQTNEEYIRDPRFKAWGLTWWDITDPRNPVQPWVRRPDIQRWSDSIDWSRTALVAQNAQFDASVLAWHYGARPVFIFDTLSMGRALRGVEAGNSLEKLAQAYGLPPKGTALSKSEGYLDVLPAHIEREIAEYCTHDTWLCGEIFLRMFPQFPKGELRLIDMTLQMYVRPVLQLDQEMLAEALGEERAKREALLQRLNVTDSMLASNPHFAELLRGLGVEPPLKTSKTTGKKTLALAKNDAHFQALLHHENEDIAALCEARLKVKSTTERTRAQRFLDIAHRGTLPVPLTYYGALSGRWTAAKGSAINLQNLKRGSFLRKAIMAPPGHQLCAGDLSQIEPRVLGWLSDYHTLLEIFRSGVDAYAVFGSQMFNIAGLTKDSHPVERQSAKSALLGCFGASTKVLTQRGWVTIVQVQATDTVWDGEAWVTHQGVVPQGEKEVLTALGVSATSDHEILTERGWAAWSEVLTDPSRLQSALSSASLPALRGSGARSRVGAAHSSPACAAPAAGKDSWSATTSLQGVQHAATVALSARPSRLAGRKRATSPSAPTIHIASACLTASAPLSFAALTLPRAHTQTMVAAASRCILRGLKTAWRFCATLLASTAGISPRCNLTASTTTEATSPATYASSPAASTCRTSGASLREKSKRSNSAWPTSKQRMQTYDIAYAGPRNRYTILTDAGPLVVHNCGYGLGWANFAAQLLTGFLGAPPVRYDKSFAKKLGVDGEYVQRFLGWEENVKKLMEVPHTCSDEELLAHCLASKMIIDKYRATAWPVVAFWEFLDTMITRCLAGGDEVSYKCLSFRKEEVVLPNGMSLRYPNLRREAEVDENGKPTGKTNWVYGEEGVKPTKLYAGKLCNNVTQALARIVMTDGMLRVQKRFRILGTVHDELWSLVRDEEAQEAKVWVRAQMIVEPRYMPGIPLNADVGVHRRYGLAKG